MSLRILHWNPLSFNSAARQEEVITMTAKSFHVSIFVGTQQRAKPDTPLEKRKIHGVLLLEAGYGRGPLTNRSTGIAMTLSCGLRESHIVRHW
eukprot:286208-Pyramimonas_sp.AAC.1